MDHTVEKAVNIPLVVDLDGTLIMVDSLHEAFVQLSAKRPLSALSALFMLKNGRASFKAAVADHVLLDTAALPFDVKVMATIKEARAKGRKVYLATAANARFATAVAEYDRRIRWCLCIGRRNQSQGQSQGRATRRCFR